ncbi:DUF4255 domain-containing protein [Nitrosovibrio sp. Nv6]|uniref:DUF4255 domain-containing protein n=1 Tax=Nitrosovibrio sp. Nv6 TaxID=1855340 RepID=UPI0008C447F8|nr:DUF4255 domain-containing protein [Nitrosovibrio sp. Nv6]SEO73134.1 Protein of unknown function [Nitrosovibrio sp. Nv6]
MSNALAIAAVTSTMRFLLENSIQADPALTGTLITTKPPDKARGTNTGRQLNLFLYQPQTNAAFRNSEIPHRATQGEAGMPPLALNLFYLATAYGEEQRADEEVMSHHLLGRAMSTFHDHPLLGTEEIRNALPDNDLHQQIERVRITSQPMTLDEISKLWSAFQTPYRLSSFYQVAVVLIESTRQLRAPLPVLTRGRDDRGVISQPSLIPPYPAIDQLTLPARQNAVRLGETVLISGHHLDGENVRVRLTNRQLPEPRILAPEPGMTSTEVTVVLPDQPADWIADVYLLAIVVLRPDEAADRITNELPLLVAPQITAIAPNPAIRDAAGNVTLTLTCIPQIRPDQRASLLLGDREIRANAHPAQTDRLDFNITGATPGDYFLRLRVDGIDSLLIDKSTTVPVFDPSQKVTIT